MRPLTATIRARLLGGALAGTLVAVAPASAQWQHAHANSGNTGFTMVDTAPARWALTQPLGPIASGANPVIGPDGTVYVGNLDGELRAFRPDGTPYWTRRINRLHGRILASPVIGADGSIYVVSTIHYTDHRGGVTNVRNDSFLHKFLPGGARVFAVPFPEEYSSRPKAANRGATTAAPNIWRWSGIEAIVIPVVYRKTGKGTNSSQVDLRLLAFSTSGAVLASQLVSGPESPTTTGGCDGGTLCLILELLEQCIHFDGGWPFHCPFLATSDIPFAVAGIPLPGVAIQSNPYGGAPLVMVTNGRYDRITYTFSPQTGFSQLARTSRIPGRRPIDEGRNTFATPPVALGNGDTLVGTLDGRLVAANADFSRQLVYGSALGALTAAPTQLADGSIVIVNREGIVTVMRGYDNQFALGGGSIASAAASCNHFFVTTQYELVTYDARTLAWLASVPWMSGNGGLSSPVIGPSGRVYAIVSDTLYVFPPPWRPPWADTRPPSCALLPPLPTAGN
jgi:outer membrane protein assembly factor BamB